MRGTKLKIDRRDRWGNSRAYPRECIYQRLRSPFRWAKIVPYKGGKPIFASTKRTRKDQIMRKPTLTNG